jgi:hypothetical protein
LPGPKPAKDQWVNSLPKTRHLEREPLCSTTFFYNSLAKDFGGNHYGRYLFAFYNARFSYLFQGPNVRFQLHQRSFGELDKDPRFRGIIPSLSGLQHVQQVNNMESAARSASPSKQRKASSSRAASSQPNSPIKGQPRFPAPAPLGEWANRVPASKNGSKANSAPSSRKSTKSTDNYTNNRPASIAELETTPPPRNPFSHDVTGLDENRVHDLLLDDDQQQHAKPQPAADKRKPRPSLSDRTVGTLSLISPTPSPGGRKSTFNVDSPMAPPSQPMSTIRKTRTRNAFGVHPAAREPSPTKKPLKASAPSLPVKTPPMAHLSKLPLPSPTSSPLKAAEESELSGLAKPTPTIKKAPTSRATITVRSTFNRPTLSTLFRHASNYSSATSASSAHFLGDLERTPRAAQRTAIMPRTPSLESIPFSITGSTSRSASTSSGPSASEFEHAEETQTISSRASSTSSDRFSSAEPSPAREYFDKEPEPELESISLDLSSTNLTSFPIYSLTDPNIFTNLTSLNLSHNTLDATKYLDNYLFLPHLRVLSLVSTGLTTIHPLSKHLSAPAMKSLNISCHHLSGPVPKFRYYFPMLEEVIATDGWFDVVETRTLVGLKMLDLRNNYIGEADVEDRRGDWKVLGVEVLL